MNDNRFGGTIKRIGLCRILAIVFIVLKLTGVITWSWLWVLAPLWIPAVVLIAICIVVFIRSFFESIMELLLK